MRTDVTNPSVWSEIGLSMQERTLFLVTSASQLFNLYDWTRRENGGSTIRPGVQWWLILELILNIRLPTISAQPHTLKMQLSKLKWWPSQFSLRITYHTHSLSLRSTKESCSETFTHFPVTFLPRMAIPSDHWRKSVTVKLVGECVTTVFITLYLWEHHAWCIVPKSKALELTNWNPDGVYPSELQMTYPNSFARLTSRCQSDFTRRTISNVKCLMGGITTRCLVWMPHRNQPMHVEIQYSPSITKKTTYSVVLSTLANLSVKETKGLCLHTLPDNGTEHIPMVFFNHK